MDLIEARELGLVDRYYIANPEKETVLPDGWALRDGMRVLIEATSSKRELKYVDDNADTRYFALLLNRFCTVKSLRVGADAVHFVGVYDDGSVLAREHFVQDAWIVKNDSIPAGYHEEFEDFVAQNYSADPETDTILPTGDLLEEGMIVLANNRADRADLRMVAHVPSVYEKARINNRWMKVISVETNTFLARYPDGTMRHIGYGRGSSWIVKKNSIPPWDDEDEAELEKKIQSYTPVQRVNKGVVKYEPRKRVNFIKSPPPSFGAVNVISDIFTALSDVKAPKLRIPPQRKKPSADHPYGDFEGTTDGSE